MGLWHVAGTLRTFNITYNRYASKKTTVGSIEYDNFVWSGTRRGALAWARLDARNLADHDFDDLAWRGRPVVQLVPTDQRMALQGAPMLPGLCETCGQVLPTHTTRTFRYCSNACRQKAYRDRKRIRNAQQAAAGA